MTSTVHYVSELQSFPVAMKSFNDYFALGFSWTPFNMKSKVDITKNEVLVLHKANPEKLAVLQLLRNIKSKPHLCAVPILILSQALCEDAKKLLDSYDFIWHSEAPFNSHDYFSKLKELYKFSEVNQITLKLFTFVKIKISKSEPDAALEKIKNLEEVYSNSYQLNFMYAEIYRLKKDYTKAIEHAELAKKSLPDSLEINSLLTALYKESGQDEKLEGLLEETLELAKIQMTNLLHWGDQYLQNGDDEKALKTFKAAIAMDPEREKAQQGVVAANILAGKSDITESLPVDIIGAIEIARICNLNGIAMVNKGEFSAAERLYSNAVNFVPKNQGQNKLYYNLGLCMKKSDDLEKAKMYFQKSSQVSSEPYEKAKAQIKWVEKAIQEKSKKSEETKTIDYSTWKPKS